MTNIVTYHSVNAKPHEAWIAYVVLPSGEQWLVRCTGHSELEAKTKAQVLWDKECKRYQVHNSIVDGCDVQTMVRVDRRSAIGSRASEMFKDKVWVINRATHDLKRIDPNELDSYLANGYVRGGPRSK